MITAPVRAEVLRIEKALVNALKPRLSLHVYCDDGTWFASIHDEDGWTVEAINISQLARDLERELSC
jgi:hypothetical protein